MDVLQTTLLRSYGFLLNALMCLLMLDVLFDDTLYSMIVKMVEGELRRGLIAVFNPGSVYVAAPRAAPVTMAAHPSWVSWRAPVYGGRFGAYSECALLGTGGHSYDIRTDWIIFAPPFAMHRHETF